MYGTGARIYGRRLCAGTQEVEMEMGGWVPAGDGRTQRGPNTPDRGWWIFKVIVFILDCAASVSSLANFSSFRSPVAVA